MSLKSNNLVVGSINDVACVCYFIFFFLIKHKIKCVNHWLIKANSMFLRFWENGNAQKFNKWFSLAKKYKYMVKSNISAIKKYSIL